MKLKPDVIVQHVLRGVGFDTMRTLEAWGRTVKLLDMGEQAEPRAKGFVALIALVQLIRMFFLTMRCKPIFGIKKL